MSQREPVPDQPARVLVGDRVRLVVDLIFTAAGEPGTVVGVDRTSPRPLRVTLDNAPEPFDLVDVRDDEVESLTSDEERAK